MTLALDNLENSAILKGVSVPYEVLRNKILLLEKPVNNLDEIIRAYTVYGRLTTIGNLMPLCQAIHETGWFTSRRWVDNYNPAGIGATNDGAEGNKWKNPTEGIIAQYAHLLAYSINQLYATSTQKTLMQLSPRYAILEKNKLLGVATRWVDLNGRWAYPGKTYAQAIANIAKIFLIRGNYYIEN
jgi:N-acetylmuramoyl-L-alanine amidase